MKKEAWAVLCAAVLFTGLLAGCGNRTAETASEQTGGTDMETVREEQKESGMDASEQDQPEAGQAETADNRTPEERAAEFVPQVPQHIQEDEEYLYFMYYDSDFGYSICRQAKADGSRETVFDEDGSYIGSFAVAEGNLYVYSGESIWFVDGKTLQTEKSLEQLTQARNLCVKDRLLYFEQKNEEETEYRQIFYTVVKDGRPGEKLSAGRSFPSLSDPEAAESWWLETENFGVCIRENEAYYVQRSAAGEVIGEQSRICEEFPDILYYDEAALYVGVNREPREKSQLMGNYDVLRFDRDSLTAETVCSIPGSAGHNGVYRNGPASVGILGDELYYLYLDQEEGKDYLAVTKIGDGGTVTKLGEALSVDPAAGIGSLSIAGSNVYCPVCGARDWYWQQELVLEETYSGDAQINAYLQKYYREKKEYAQKFVEESSFLEDGCIHHEINSPISSEAFLKVVYDGGRYLNLLRASYEYSGGAHGMPARDSLLFDRKTGVQLKLSDVIGNTEEELKTMVADAFCNPPYCGGYEDWALRRQDVYDAAGLSMLFHLSEDGITFYFTPYEVASYAEGFPEMTIPYAQLDMKITP